MVLLRNLHFREIQEILHLEKSEVLLSISQRGIIMLLSAQTGCRARAVCTPIPFQFLNLETFLDFGVAGITGHAEELWLRNERGMWVGWGRRTVAQCGSAASPIRTLLPVFGSATQGHVEPGAGCGRYEKG
jgi:hypothetical protein